ncbi:MAG: hypothetical protein GY953_36675, partial [bacterium]|nr:hypothetical protein [bacterium]
LGALLTAFTASATIVPRLTLERLVSGSEIIVHGRVLDSRVAWNEKRNYIWTHYRVEVEDSIKSSGQNTVTVSVPGGIVDGVGLRVSGATRFEPNEEVVLFLRRTPIGYYRATGWGQGKYSVITDEATGEKRLRTNVGGITLVDRIGKAGTRPRSSSLTRLDDTSLTEFKARLREMVRSNSEGGGQ